MINREGARSVSNCTGPIQALSSNALVPFGCASCFNCVYCEIGSEADSICSSLRCWAYRIMPIPPFHADTFVAFMDIAGFKSMMSDGKRASLALDAFYSTGFLVLRDQLHPAPKVDGFFISDCGVLFVRGEERRASDRLGALCRIIQQIHQRAFESAVQLTTSIAWGDFSYDERIEFRGIEKNPIYGNAYIAAFADNEGSPKLYPNECRLLRDGLPPDVDDFLIRTDGDIPKRMRKTLKHFYYEWMRK